MYELKEEEAKPKTRWKWPHFLSGFVLLICGVLIGRALFPIEITKTLVVEKEKRVEVPVEVSVDRVTDRVVTRHVGGTTPTTGNYAGHYEQWKLVNKGMSQRQVFDILGKPDGPPEEHGLSILYRWGGGVVVFGSFADGRLA